MATYNVHAGHNFKVPGAGGCFSETQEARNVKDLVISKLRSLGHTVYDCTDEDGSTSLQNLANIVSKCNQHAVDYDISIHFNAFNGQAHGVEVLNYNDKTAAVCNAILSKIVALGFTNRGVKNGSQLYVLRNTNAKSFLIECCFCDNAGDASKYTAEKMATAIVEGLTGQHVSGGQTSAPANSTPAQNNDQMYRIRKSWSDVKSQIGAYRNLDNAKKECMPGYSVFDKDGNVVYAVPFPVTNTTPNDEMYRVRKSWGDAKSQLGAYKILDNAKRECPAGYSVFDKNGNAVYTPKVEQQPPVTPPEEKPAEKPSTDENKAVFEDISPLKGITSEAFIAYVGQLAKKDMETSGVLASVTIAQAILESAWGQSELSIKANNLFGMKASLSGNTWKSDWSGVIYAKVSPEDDGNGNITQVRSDFRLYATPEQSIIDHSNYLCGAKNGSKLRYEGLSGEKDPRKAVQIIKDGGYATDSKYVDRLCDIIERYHLDAYDDCKEPSDLMDEKKELEDIKKEMSEMKGMLSTILNIIQKIASIFSFSKK